MESSSIRSFARKSARAEAPGALGQSFYRRHTLEVARDLLGKIVRVEGRGGATWGRIVETEAYRATDPASHSARGKTPRASIMFGEPGVAYVYFIYGMYEMLNFVTEPEGDAGAVLIRALEPLGGLGLMRLRRPAARADRELANGPGKLCVALGILRLHNGASLEGPAIEVLDDGFRVGPSSIRISPRVGITAGQEKYWRFFLGESPCVSRAPENRLSKPFRLKARSG